MGSLETEPRKPCRPIASNWRPKGNFISFRDSREGCVEAREEIESGMELKLESGNSEGKEQSNQPLRVWQAGRQCSHVPGRISEQEVCRRRRIRSQVNSNKLPGKSPRVGFRM